jgi:hypothetical protein
MFTQAKILVAAVSAALVTLFAASRANADTREDYGGFMTFGGSTSDTGNGMCIANDSGTIDQEPCPVSSGLFDTTADEDWKVVAVTSQYALIHSVIGGVDQGCLDIFANNPANNILDIATCSTTNQAQQWTFANGRLVPLHHTTYCVDVHNGSGTAGTVVDIVACAGNDQQMFLPVNFTIQASSSSGECLDVNGNGTANGTKLDVYTCGSTNTAQWYQFQPESTAGFHATLFGQHSGKYVGWDVVNGDAAYLTTQGGTAQTYWEYGNATNLVNSSMGPGGVNTLYTCLDLGTSGSPTYTAENGCNFISNQAWDITILGM